MNVRGSSAGMREALLVACWIDLSDQQAILLKVLDNSVEQRWLMADTGCHGSAGLVDAVVAGKLAGVGCSIRGVSHGTHRQAGCALAAHAAPGHW